MDAKLPLTCRDLAAFLSHSWEKKKTPKQTEKHSLHWEMKGQVVETRKVSFTCHIKKGLANKKGSGDGKTGIVGIVNWGFSLFYLFVFFLSILSLLEVFTLNCHSQWCILSQTSAENPGPQCILGHRSRWWAPNQKRAQIRRQISQRVGAEMSAGTECLVNMFNKKPDRLIFDKLMRGKLFTRYLIGFRFDYRDRTWSFTRFLQALLDWQRHREKNIVGSSTAGLRTPPEEMQSRQANILWIWRLLVYILESPGCSDGCSDGNRTRVLYERHHSCVGDRANSTQDLGKGYLNMLKNET